MLRASALVVCLLSSLPSIAAKFEPVPAEPKAKPNGLQMRVVRYNGGTNGAITVEVKNPTSAPLEFAAAGVFFVPNVNPDNAPQRLGAVGPFIRSGKKDREEKLMLGANETAELTLDVYCIDSHRPSPNSETPFRIASERMPRELSQGIDANTKNAAKSYGGVNAAPAKSAVQSEVWKTRDAKWIKLDGEGKQEANK
ncbi:MAG: hypothetical protein ACO1OB_18055 [Archangium sp.]